MKYSDGFIGTVVTVTMDQPIGSLHPTWGWEYPINYGYVAGTIAPDGEGLDAYVLGIDVPLESFTGQVIGKLIRPDDDDDKLIVVPEGMKLTDQEIMDATHIQEQWFNPTLHRAD